MSSLYIAWRYLMFNKSRAATLIGVVALLIYLPLALDLLLEESERQLVDQDPRPRDQGRDAPGGGAAS